MSSTFIRMFLSYSSKHHKLAQNFPSRIIWKSSPCSVQTSSPFSFPDLKQTGWKAVADGTWGGQWTNGLVPAWAPDMQPASSLTVLRVLQTKHGWGSRLRPSCGNASTVNSMGRETAVPLEEKPDELTVQE